jgi:hypothetical protein
MDDKTFNNTLCKTYDYIPRLPSTNKPAFF